MRELEPAEIETILADLQRKVDRLKVLYEQYFMGVTRRVPRVAQTEVVRVMHLLDQQKIRNTGLRHRYRTIVQRYNTYRSYWNRTLRAIEMGTYTRDLVRAYRRMGKGSLDAERARNVRTRSEAERLLNELATSQEERKAPTGQAAQSPPRPSDSGESGGSTTGGLQAGAGQPVGGAASSRTQTAAARPLTDERPPATPAKGQAGDTTGEDPELGALFKRYVAAKRQCGEDTTRLSYQTLAATVGRELPKLQRQHPGRDLGFDVVIRDGRAILKVVPKTRS